MSLNDKTKILRSLLKEYKESGIVAQMDYNKFYLYSLITHSTAIEGSTVTEIENQLLFDEGISAKGRSIQEQMMNLDLKIAYEHSMKLARHHTDFSINILKELSAPVIDPIKPQSDPIKVLSDPITNCLYQALMQDGSLSYAEYGSLLHVSEATVKRRLGRLKKAGVIVRVGSNKKGYWKIIDAVFDL